MHLKRSAARKAPRQGLAMMTGFARSRAGAYPLKSPRLATSPMSVKQPTLGVCPPQPPGSAYEFVKMNFEFLTDIFRILVYTLRHKIRNIQNSRPYEKKRLTFCGSQRSHGHERCVLVRVAWTRKHYVGITTAAGCTACACNTQTFSVRTSPPEIYCVIQPIF